MKKRNTRQPVMVGIFVFMAMVLFGIAIFILGGQKGFFERNVNVYAIFSNVEGLKKGNNVWFSGVKIGVIKEIKFHGKSDVIITMHIEQAASKYIHKDAKVVLSSESFIGNKIIEIVGGTTATPSVQEGDYLDVMHAAGTSDIMKTLQENNRNVLAITEDLKTLSQKAVKGEGLIGALFSNQGMANSVEKTISNLEQTSQSAQGAIAQLNSFASKLNKGDGLINELATDTVIYKQLSTTAASLQETASQASRLTQNLNQASEQLKNKNNAAGMLLNDEEFARNMETTMTNLQKSSAELNKTLQALQKTFLLRRQVRKLEEGK